MTAGAWSHHGSSGKLRPPGIAEREPWVEDSGAVLSLLDDPDTEGLVAAHSFTTLFYLASMHLGRERAAALAPTIS